MIFVEEYPLDILYTLGGHYTGMWLAWTALPLDDKQIRKLDPILHDLCMKKAPG